MSRTTSALSIPKPSIGAFSGWSLPAPFCCLSCCPMSLRHFQLPLALLCCFTIAGRRCVDRSLAFLRLTVLYLTLRHHLHLLLACGEDYLTPMPSRTILGHSTPNKSRIARSSLFKQSKSYLGGSACELPSIVDLTLPSPLHRS